jgi:hypothetical protein
VAVIITGDRAANLDLCLAFTAFSSECYWTCHTYCDTGLLFFKRSCLKDQLLSFLNDMLLAKEQSLRILTSWVWRGHHERCSNSWPPGC